MGSFRIRNSPVPRAPAQPGFGKRAAVSGHCNHRAAHRSTGTRGALRAPWPAVRLALDQSQVHTGYEDFHEFDARELHLVEALRTLRLIHYSAWIARRWDDPAFPAAFPLVQHPALLAGPDSGIARVDRADGRAAAMAGVTEAIWRRWCPG